MSFPEHPETIILKNKFYPKGLTEQDVYNYYQKVKSKIIQETRLREIMFLIATDVNTLVVKRKHKGEFLKLTNDNYDEIITGRTLSIHSTMGMYEDFGIIDIDINDWKEAKRTTLDVYEFVMDKVPIVKTTKIRYTGKNSFHIVCNFNRKLKIDTIRDLLTRFLTTDYILKKYTVGSRRVKGLVNLDISPNKYRGGYITEGSLSIWGLRCMEVPYNKIISFEPQQARI